MTAHYSWVSGAIGDGAEIVTASRRLARELRHAYDEQQLLLGRESWHTPRIFSWEVWLDLLFDNVTVSAASPLRLHAHASAILWERLLADMAGERLLSPNRLVRQVRQVWQRLQDWCIPIDMLQRSASSEDERLFATAARRYQAELGANAWIDSAQLASFVTERLAHGELAAPRRIVHAGFDRLTPAAQNLLRTLEDRGCEVIAAPARAATPVPVAVSCSDADAELRTAGSWARRQLTEHESARIAIIHPALEQDAPRAARLVREGFAPGWQQGGERHLAAVNVSYGKRLSEYPLIAVALLWLKWLHRGLSSREVSVLLRTPLAAMDASDSGSRLELLLRRLPDRSWTAASLAGALRDRDRSDEARAFLGRVDRVATFGRAAEERAAPAVWAAAIDQLLEQLGWPGARPLDSLEFQLVNRWRQLLNEWSRIDVVRPRLGFPEAITRLSVLASETVYQPEAGAGLVQLAGTLEAAGLEFDHVWIADLHALQWPPPAHPLPFVSRALQRQSGMPDATAADTLEFSRRTLARLVASAPSVVLSWPRADRESSVTPSPLLQPYLGAGSAQWPDPGWHAASYCGRAIIDRGIDDPAPPVQAGEKIHGGAYTVQRQVNDPLSAFAFGRLGIRELRRIETGLSAATRGSIIHHALHVLFLETPASAEMKSWPAEERRARIDTSVESALSEHLRHADGVLRRLLALERRRLRAMLLDFLDEELKRSPFSIASVETELAHISSGVRLGLRVDRIDRLADGSYLVIDYKTGRAKTFLDLQGQPKDLQLVVYACAFDGKIGGLTLINVDSRGIRYKGTGSSVPWGNAAPELWDERLQTWKNSVHRAISQIAAGDVRINTAPAASPRTLNVLSRIEELKRGL